VRYKLLTFKIRNIAIICYKLNRFNILQQLSFDFPSQETYGLDDFIVSKANCAAFNFVSNYNIKNEKLPRIFGVFAPKMAGKTYLAHIWQKKFAGQILNLKELENTNLIQEIKSGRFYIVEDINEVKNYKLLLQIINLIGEKSSYLMITSNKNLKDINCDIKDLSSRLKNIFEIEIKNPDDDLIKMLLIKNFSEKQIAVNNLIIDFLLKIIPRNFAAIFNTVKLLEFYSLEKKRAITIPLIKEVLGQNEVIV
jgi:chromosomal replication initiation ATPase DnaA